MSINGSIHNAATDWIIENAICADPENKPKGVVEEKDRHILEEWQDDHFSTTPEVIVVNPVRKDYLTELRSICSVAQVLEPFGELKLILDEDHIDGASLLQKITYWTLSTPQAYRELDVNKLNYLITLLSVRRDNLLRGFIPTSLAPGIPKSDRKPFPKICDSRKARRQTCIIASEGLSFEQGKAKLLLLGLGAQIDEKDESSVICPSCRIAPETLVGIANPRVS